MTLARFLLCVYILALKSSKSILPSITFTGTTFIPTKTALAGLVPWAVVGIRQIFLCPCPMLSR